MSQALPMPLQEALKRLGSVLKGKQRCADLHSPKRTAAKPLNIGKRTGVFKGNVIFQSLEFSGVNWPF